MTKRIPRPKLYLFTNGRGLIEAREEAAAGGDMRGGIYGSVDAARESLATYWGRLPGDKRRRYEIIDTTCNSPLALASIGEKA